MGIREKTPVNPYRRHLGPSLLPSVVRVVKLFPFIALQRSLWDVLVLIELLLVVW